MIDKRYHSYLKDMATDEEIQNCLIFGQPALEYTKEELLAFICWVFKENEKTQKRHGEVVRELILGNWRK